LNCKDIFAKQLLQIPGHTPETCSAIVNLYPTPKSLILAYRVVQKRERKVGLLLQNSQLIDFLGMAKPKISRRDAERCCCGEQKEKAGETVEPKNISFLSAVVVVGCGGT